MRSLIVCIGLTLGISALFCAQDTAIPADFSIVLKRLGCLGSCPDYEVTIWGNGRVRYEGHAYVRVKGVREHTIPMPNVQKLVRQLQDDEFFHWDETDLVCLDFPEVHITAIAGAQRKHVLEGCNKPGKILALAQEIDRISGAGRLAKRQQ